MQEAISDYEKVEREAQLGHESSMDEDDLPDDEY